ncbi:MAG: carboxypeptidase-like regulatory domain-containing protein [Luteibaculum sp.]
MHPRILCFCFSAVFFLCTSGIVNAQKRSFRLLDSERQTPIAYANVLAVNSNKGTASDIDGWVRFDDLSDSDTLLISYLGYERLSLPVKQLSDQVFLKAQSYELQAVHVLADDRFLYRLVADVRKKRKHKVLQSKAYYNLSSYKHNKRVELMEAYYNAQIRGYELHQIEYKIGRLGLEEIDQGFWVSSETSKAFLFHESFNSNAYFPASPLEFNFRSMMEEFRLQLLGRYEEKDAILYHLAYEPKNQSSSAFSGQLWIDSTHMELQKASFVLKQSKKHPFLPIGNNYKISSVDISLNKTFSIVDGQMAPERVDFDYQVHYTNSSGTSDSTRSQAAFFFYNYQQQFNLPLFAFAEGMHGDYRKIDATPYNDFFWLNHNEFRIWGDEKEQQQFLNQKKRSSIDSLFVQGPKSNGFESPYFKWNKDLRVAYQYKRQNPLMKTGTQSPLGNPSAKIELGLQLYLDVNQIGDSLHLMSAAILDPYNTYLRIQKDSLTDVLFNLGLDEAEIARHALIEEIGDERDFGKIKLLHERAQLELEKRVKFSLYEARFGTDFEQVEKWNLRVSRNLGVDNLAAFGFKAPNSIP